MAFVVPERKVVARWTRVCEPPVLAQVMQNGMAASKTTGEPFGVRSENGAWSANGRCGTVCGMTRDALLTFLRAQAWAVQASVGEGESPQAAVIGVAVTEELELVFDTLGTSRKAVNLRANPKIALVLGWDEGQTVQYEGVADEPTGEELERLKRLYLQRFPDGREREALPDIAYFRVSPIWIRYSDFRQTPPNIVVFQDFSSSVLAAE